MSWNINLFFFINSLTGKNRWLDAAARAGAEWILPIMFGWVAVAAYARYDRSPAQLIIIAVTLTIVLSVGILCSYGIAAIVRERRPYVLFPGRVEILFRPLLDWKSFPSDHALAAFLLIGTAYCFGLPGIPALIIMAIWVMLGRIYAGVHFPLDMFAGMTLGALVLLVYALVGLPLVRDAVLGASLLG